MSQNTQQQVSPQDVKAPANQDTTQLTTPTTSSVGLDSLRSSYAAQQEAQIQTFLQSHGFESSTRIYQNNLTGSHVYRSTRNGADVVIKVSVPTVFQDALGSVKFSEDYAKGEETSLRKVAESSQRLYPGERLFPTLQGRISDGNELHGVVLEYIPGKNGQEYLESLKIEDRQMSTDQLVTFLRSGLVGVHCLQDAGLRHRDLNPRNIIIDETGEVKIIDLNFSKQLNQTAFTTIEPEGFYPPDAYGPQASGLSVDSYAIGMMALSLFTQQRPFDLVSAKGEVQVHDAKLDPALKNFLKKLCATNPKDRFADPQSAIRELDKIARKLARAGRVDKALAESSVQPSKQGWNPLGFIRGMRERVEVERARVEQAQAVSRLETVDGHKAVTGKITVNGQQLESLLSEKSFDKTRGDQKAYAEKLGCRMATREEHRAYVEGLLAKEGNNTINDAEKNALKTYRRRYVRDDAGGLGVVGRRVCASGPLWYHFGFRRYGALFVRAHHDGLGAYVELPDDRTGFGPHRAFVFSVEPSKGTVLEELTTLHGLGAYVELPDDRTGFGPHRAFVFSVEPSKGTVLEELTTLLGQKAAKLLAADWGNRCDLNQKLEATEVALFLDSNNKARNRDYAGRGDKTTQEEDFQATVHQVAADLAATLLCARIFKKAQDSEPLSEGEQDLYQKLKDGVLRSCSGALGLDDLLGLGRLRAFSFFVGRYSRSFVWALGSPLSPELQ